jgi:hypothetical protein
MWDNVSPMMQTGIQSGDPVPLLDGHWSADGLTFAVSDKVSEMMRI